MKTAIISVYDKTNIVKLSKFFVEKNVRILSTGGTFNKISNAIKTPLIQEVSSETEFPEILNGRVKTLHPKIHGGILAKKDNENHIKDLENNNINPIDFVVTNLYPFESVLKNNPNDEELLLENIDIGGHTLIRAAAKNYKDVMVLTDPNDYDIIINKWDDIVNNSNKEAIELRKNFAQKAFQMVTKYDMAISGYFTPTKLYREYDLVTKLKYGANPQQQFAGLYKNSSADKMPFEILNGKPGYINILDAIYGWNLVSEIANETKLPCVASYKHNSPAGVAVYKPLSDIERKMYFVKPNVKLTELAVAFLKARNVDPKSSFGDFLAISCVVDECTAKLIKTEVSDGIIAQGYTKEAFKILSKKKKGNYVILRGNLETSSLEVREMHGLCLVQDKNKQKTTFTDFDNYKIESIEDNQELSYDVKLDLLIANTTLKYTQSNSVVSCKNGQVLGIGAGQQSRIDCVKLVSDKTKIWYLRQHPKVLKLVENFKKGTKKTVKINAIMNYITDSFENTIYSDWLKLFDLSPDKIKDLESNEKNEFLIDNCVENSLASDGFFPFEDNITVAGNFGVKYIIQPGGSIADKVIIETATNVYDMIMVLTGKDMRMFLH